MRPLIATGATLLVLAILGVAALLTFAAPSMGTPLHDVMERTVIIGSPAS